MKTAEDLGLSEEELQALLKVREDLKQGYLRYKSLSVVEERSSGNYFNMSVGLTKHGCGSIGCIAGQMALYLNKGDFITAMRVSNRLLGHSYLNGPQATALETLFVPINTPCVWSDLTVDEAVAAITNFVETGHASWDKVCASRGRIDERISSGENL